MQNINCLVWEITLKCNAHCIHCGSSAGCFKNDELSENQAIEICSQINEAGIKNVNIIGGELFLRSDWKAIVKKLREYGIKLSIVTNGICLTKSNLHFLFDNGVKTIGVSIDGGRSKTHDYIRQVPGLYNKIFKNIRNDDTNIQYTAITTLSKLNYKELPRLSKKLVKSKFKVWEVQTASPHGRMSKKVALSPIEYYFTGIKIAQMRQTIPNTQLAIVCNHDYGYYSEFIPRITIYDKWNGCPAGKSSLGIKYNGDLQGCLSLDCKKFKECSLLDKKLKDVLSDKNYFIWNNRDIRCKNLAGYCKECRYSKTCMGGCSDVACSYTGNAANNPQCFYAIEQYYKNKIDKTDFEKLFNYIINGKIENGKVILPNNEVLTSKIYRKYKLSEEEKDLIKFIL